MKHNRSHKSNCILALVFVLFLGLSTNGQNQHSKWYFGRYAALDFMSSPPTPMLSSAMGFTSATSHSEGTSSIADASGNLLFYTNGQTIWNQNNVVMANGTGLMGHWSSTQAALIIKQPGNNSIYYVFTTDAVAPLGSGNGLNYSIVDMSLAAGMGSVTTKNVNLLTLASEKLCSVKHGNLQDIWVIAHASNSNAFYAYLLSSTGVSSPVTSSVGTPYYNQQMFPFIDNNIGYMKASPVGTKLGVAIYNISSTGTAYEIYDFDPASGTVSNPLTLLQYNGSPGHYGCEFSPDGSKFYGSQFAVVTNTFGNPIVTSAFHQWNLCAGSSAAIIASHYTATCGANAIQLAPDGKIYGSMSGQSTLCVFNNPNASGAACNFNLAGPSIATNICSLGLPNFTNHYQPNFSAITSTVVCQSATFTSASNSVSGCGPSAYTVAASSWSFGDPASASANSSTLTNPTHVFSSLGTYTVSQVLYNFYQAPLDTIFHQVVISPQTSTATVSGFQICNGATFTLTAPALTSYSWNTGAPSNSIVVSPQQTTSYTVQGFDANLCLRKAIQTITVFPLPPINISGPGLVCQGQQIVLTATGANSYTWSNGTTVATTSFIPLATSFYTVVGTSSNGCSASATRTITVGALPVLTITGQSIICTNGSALLTAAGASTYSWSTAAVSNTILVSPLSTSQYTLVGTDSYGCKNTAKITVTVSACSGLNPITANNKALLYPNPNNGTFYLQVSSPDQACSLKIIDNLGKTVFEKKQVYDAEHIYTNLASGNYIYILSSESEAILIGKLIIE